MRQRRTVLIGAATAAVLLLGMGAWSVVNGDERSPEDTVTAFFDARQRGDCEELLGLVSESSWSGDGRLGREEFLEICADIVEGYQPKLHEVDVRSETGDQAVVALQIVAGDIPATDLGAPKSRVEGIAVEQSLDLEGAEEETLAYEYGRLVREDGEWRVELDQRAFGLGRSAEQTVWGYLEAYRAGDCEAMLDHLSERAWSNGGETDRDEFLANCSTAAAARTTSPAYEDLPMLSTTPPIALPQSIEVSRRADGATARIPWMSGARAEALHLVVEDLEWKIDTGTLETFELVELGTRLAGQPDQPTSSWSFAAVPVYANSESDYGRPLAILEGDDAVQQRRKAGFVRGLTIDAGPWNRSVELLLYEFADAAGANAYAAHLMDRIVARASEYTDVSPVPVPGVEGATAIVTECSGSGFRPRSAGGDCSHANKAATVAAQGHYVVAVEAVDFKGADPTAAAMRAQAVTALKAQLRRL